MKHHLGPFLLLLLFTISCGSGKLESKNETIGTAPVEAETSVEAEAPLMQQEMGAFVLANHTILDYKKGDLNNDGQEDVVLVLKRDNEAETSDVTKNPAPRPLLLLLRQPDGTLQLAARNDKAVLCSDCGGVMGDPFQGITIKGNYFSVEHYGGSAWRWTRIITFRFDPKANEWYLHKEGGHSYHVSNPDSITDEKVETTKDFGVVRFVDYDVYKEE